jgi:hypothetical protein
MQRRDSTPNGDFALCRPGVRRPGAISLLAGLAASTMPLPQTGVAVDPL